MRRHRTMMGMMALLFCLTLIVVLGCAPKQSLRKEALVEGEQTVTAEQAGAVQEAAKPVVTAQKPEAAAQAPAAGGTSIALEEKVSAVTAQAEAAKAAEPLPQVPVAVAPVLAQAQTESNAPSVREETAWEDIRFDFDKFSLMPEARTLLDKVGDWLIKNKEYVVAIEGHCDERGTTEYNLALGERRAMEAKKYLTDLGVDGNRIKTISYGKEMPLDSGQTEEAWAKNRRDHFVVKISK